MSDARFLDAGPSQAGDAPLRLMALDGDDVPPLSALMQDAVFTGADVTFIARRRRFAVLLTRFRWEDQHQADIDARPYERVRSLLLIDNVIALRSAGLDIRAKDAVQSVLAMTWAAQDRLAGCLTIALAGGGAIAMDIEAIDITLRDVARPHRAQSRARPDHGA